MVIGSSTATILPPKVPILLPKPFCLVGKALFRLAECTPRLTIEISGSASDLSFALPTHCPRCEALMAALACHDRQTRSCLSALAES